MPVHMHVGAHKGQKRMLDPLEIVLQVSCELPSMGSGNQTQVLWKNGKSSQFLSRLYSNEALRYQTGPSRNWKGQLTKWRKIILHS